MNWMEHQIEAERSELKDILSSDASTGKKDRLKELALRVGASTVNPYAGYGDASSPQLVSNIHQALQTKAMIGALQVSRRYVIVTVILAVITLGAAIATWCGVLKITVCNKGRTNQGVERTLARE